MRIERTDRVLLTLSELGFFGMSMSLTLMPIEKLGLWPGCIFWAGLALGAGLQIILALRRRAYYSGQRRETERVKKPRTGLMTFGANRAAAIADNVMAASFALLIIALIRTRGYGRICYILASITVFAFCMHCVWNGRVYLYVKNRARRQSAQTQKEINRYKGEREK